MQPNASSGVDRDALNLARSIGIAESGGGGKPNYNAKGDKGTSWGAYQFQPGVFEARAQTYGLNPSDRSPENQDKVQYAWTKAQKDKGYQPWEIASMHNAGEGRPDAWKNHKGFNQKLGVSYDTPAYVSKVKQSYLQMQQQSQSQPQQPINPDSLQGDLQKRKEQFQAGQADVQSGAISPARGLLRAAGAGAGAVGDTAMRAVSAIVPDEIGAPAMEYAGGKIQGAMESPIGSMAVGAWKGLEEKKPQVAQDIRDVANLAGVTPIGFGGKVAAQQAGKAASKVAERSAKKQLSGLAADYAEVLGTRSPLRARVDRASQKGRDLASFLAEKARGTTGAKLEVDADGNVDASKLVARNEEDLQGLYKLRADLLKQYPETGDIEALRGMALKASDSAQNKAKGIVGELQKEVNNVFDSLKGSYGERLPLELLQDIKIAQRLESKAFNALKPKRDRFSNSNYLVSDAAKRYIEDITKNPLVREINDVIGEHLDADDLLERISIGGAKVKGGRLGKYSLAGIGALAGTAAESAISPVLGGMVGHYIAGKMLQNQLSGPLRNFILNRVKAERPDIYKQVEDFIGADELRKSQMLQLPAAGQSSFQDPKMFVTPSGKASSSLQEAVDATGPTPKGLVPAPQSRAPQAVSSSKDTKKPGLIQRMKDAMKEEKGFIANPLAKKKQDSSLHQIRT